MSQELVNAIKRHTAAQIAQIGQTRMATVASVNPSNYTARVMIQPEGVLSGWLPIMAHQIGSGWGLVSPPMPGEQVVVQPTEGASEHGIIIGRVFSTDTPPPNIYSDPRDQGSTSHVQPGEIGLVHEDGTFIRLVGGRVLIHGDLYCSGDIFDRHGSLDRLRSEYNAHHHTQVKAGGDVSGPTDDPDPETI